MGRTVPVLVGALALTLAGCGDDGGGPGTEGEAVAVVASFYPLAEVAERVGGARVAVTNLTTAGAEPHDLEITPADVDRIEDADVVLVLGHGFQPAVEDATERRDSGTVELLGELPIDAEGRRVEDDHADEDDQGEEDDHADDDDQAGDEGGLDPHVWLDPVLMVDVVDAVRDALVDADPDHAATYERNAVEYQAEIEALHAEYAAGLSGCERTTIVTAHDAFEYLTSRYGLTQQPIGGLSPDEEPDPRRLATLADLVEREGVTTIFTETLVSPALAETLAREAGGLETAVLNPLEGLADDEIDAGESYVSVMQANLEALRTALGCP